MEEIATDIYSFEELRESGYAYVDKTGLVVPLVIISKPDGRDGVPSPSARERCKNESFFRHCGRRWNAAPTDGVGFEIATLVNMSIGKQFSLARPRRLGKSLLVSTLHCLFDGRRDLFQGLAIEPLWDWAKRGPVLHLDLGSCQAKTVEDLWDALRIVLQSEAARPGVHRPTSRRSRRASPTK